MKKQKNNLLQVIILLTFITTYSQKNINTINKASLHARVIELKQTEALQIFINRAKEAKVSVKNIDTIIFANALKDYRIAALKEHRKSTSKTFLINITDRKFDKNSFIRDYRRTISAVLSEDQFKYIYKDLLDLQIEREIKETLSQLQKKYVLTHKNDISTITKWVKLFTNKAVVAQQYFAYDKKLSAEKYQEILNEASSKYYEIIQQLNIPLAKETFKTSEEHFFVKAKEANVSENIAQKIIALSKQAKSQIKKLEKLNKSSEAPIYLLETNNNSKNAIKNSFKKQLAGLININQFKNIFGSQLQKDINEEISSKMFQITSAYTLTDAQQDDIKSLVTDFITKDIVTQHYFGFDKKLVKQKRKVIKFKFDKAYMKKIKAFIAQ